MPRRPSRPKGKRRDRFRRLDKSMKGGPGGTILACGKVCHPSKQAAKSAVRASLGDGDMDRKEQMNMYHCSKCSAWHIGHDHKKELPE